MRIRKTRLRFSSGYFSKDKTRQVFRIQKEKYLTEQKVFLVNFKLNFNV